MKLPLNPLAKAIKLTLLASAITLPAFSWANLSFDEQKNELKVEQKAEQKAEQESAVERTVANNNQVSEKQAVTANNEAEEEIELIQVTGSRLGRTSYEGPDPITVITAEDMQKTGAFTLLDALQDLSQNSGLVDSDEMGSVGFTPGAQVADLRGFGPQYTLTLVNGRRLASYPAAYQSQASVVSVDSIPVAAIDRVEILTSGASAVYGSDAVSGVINVILKKDLEGSSLAFNYGTGAEHGQSSGRLQFTHGIDFDNGNITLIGEYQGMQAITGGDLDELDNANDWPFGDNYVYERGAVLVDNWAAYDYLLNPTHAETYVDPGESGCDALPWTQYEYRHKLPDVDHDASWGNYCAINLAQNQVLRPENEKLSLMRVPVTLI